MSKVIKDNKDLLPTQTAKRNIGFIDYTTMWIGMVINMGGFTLGAQFFPGLSPAQLLLAALIAYGFVTLLLTLTGDIGLRYGIPFGVYIRSIFGLKGARFMSLVRSLPSFFWFGFQTWIAAVAINKLLQMWTGYSNVTLICFLFGFLEIWNAASGVKAIAKFNWVAAPILVIFVGGSIFWLLQTNNVTLIDVLATPGNGTGSFMLAITGIAGVWVTMALNNMDITRRYKHTDDFEQLGFWKRNRGIILGALIGLITVGAGVLLTGMIGGILTGVWDPVTIITQAIPSQIVLIISILIISFAQFSTSIAAALLPTALLLVNAFPKLNYRWGVIITGLLSLIIMPWRLVPQMVMVTSSFSALVGSLGGLMVADYFILRRTKLNLGRLYDKDHFEWPGGVNWIAIAVYVVATVCAFLFIKVAFFVGFGIALILYSVIMLAMKKDKFASDRQLVESPTEQVDSLLVE